MRAGTHRFQTPTGQPFLSLVYFAPKFVHPCHDEHRSGICNAIILLYVQDDAIILLHVQDDAIILLHVQDDAIILLHVQDDAIILLHVQDAFVPVTFVIAVVHLDNCTHKVSFCHFVSIIDHLVPFRSV